MVFTQAGSLLPTEVPQGSMLGLTILSIFINSLVDGVESSLTKFADDTRLVMRHKCEREVSWFVERQVEPPLEWRM